MTRLFLYLWSLPTTLLLLLPLLLAWPFRQARPVGWHRAWEWEVVSGSILDRRWHMGAAAVGWVTLYKPGTRERLRAHETAHVEQALRLGPLAFVLWPAVVLLIWLACPRLHSYYDNPMELDARRAAGEAFEVQPHQWRLTRWWPWLPREPRE